MAVASSESFMLVYVSKPSSTKGQNWLVHAISAEHAASISIVDSIFYGDKYQDNMMQR